jgi:hypothetical protein
MAVTPLTNIVDPRPVVGAGYGVEQTLRMVTIDARVLSWHRGQGVGAARKFTHFAILEQDP